MPNRKETPCILAIARCVYFLDATKIMDNMAGGQVMYEIELFVLFLLQIKLNQVLLKVTYFSLK